MVRRLPAFLLVLAGAFTAAVPDACHATGVAGDPELQRMRAERRAASRALHAVPDKGGAAGLFGLLVIPVDYADARLPAGWSAQELSPRLTPDAGESLRHYFTVASAGKVDLRITLAPLVHLAGTRRDYSDRGLGGNAIRSRIMATEALRAVRDLGLEFRRLDMDGPDLVPGSADDDGEIDGVLILHAAPGIENDPAEGLIQPLQFFLEEPVLADGIAATFYAVASMHSGPGIWAHETAHLLGLEDRYDPLLPAEGGHATSRGGLGRFSLMSSGAWGTGDGRGAALPDAYSRVQMGWIPTRNLPADPATPDTLRPGEAVRVWSGSAPGPEFFLLEVRDPEGSRPFDAAVPGRGMIIYHLDETLPEGTPSGPDVLDYHLRVRLVEADDDRRLQRGLDDGRAEDLFPGPLEVTAFTPTTIPASDGYGGPSTVALTNLRAIPDGIAFLASTGSGAGETAGAPGPLDFAGDWPGDWIVDHPGGVTGTTWFRWEGAPHLTADQGPVLACVGAGFATPDEWPAVTYENNAWTTLTSGPLASGVAAVRLVHALEAEVVTAGEAADGGRIVWVDAGGAEQPAVPVDGYDGRIRTRIANPLHGEGAFFEDPLELEGDIPLWRTDIVEVPPGGPWRLRLVFAANPLWRERGWFVASLEPLAEVPGSAFPVAWDGDLRWSWPFGAGDREFTVSFRSLDRDAWTRLWTGTLSSADGRFVLDGSAVLAGLPGPARTRHAVRVAGVMEKGPVRSGSVVIYPDGGGAPPVLLAQPWPNPGRAPIRFQIDVPVARAAKVSIFDVRGRLLRRLEYPAGSHLGVWDGTDSGGRPAPSGTYFLRLEGSGPVTTRKVVLLH